MLNHLFSVCIMAIVLLVSNDVINVEAGCRTFSPADTTSTTEATTTVAEICNSINISINKNLINISIIVDSIGEGGIGILNTDKEYFLVNDRGNDLIYKYLPDGTVVAQNTLNKPRAIAVSQNKIYVATLLNIDTVVTVLDDQLNILPENITGIIGIQAMYYDKQAQKLYVADNNLKQFSVFDKNLSPISSFPYDQIDGSNDLAVYEDILYVVSNRNILSVYQNNEFKISYSPCSQSFDSVLSVNVDHCASVLAVTCFVDKSIVYYRINGTSLDYLATKTLDKNPYQLRFGSLDQITGFIRPRSSQHSYIIAHLG